MSFSVMCVGEPARVLVLFIGIVCVRDPVCVWVCARAHAYARDLVCVCFAMLCMKMFVNFTCFVCFYTIDLYNYGYLHIVSFSLSCKVL